MPTIRQTVETEVDVEVDFDLEDYEDDIKHRYCYGDCLKEEYNYSDLKDYIDEMYKNLYIYPECNKKIKTYEEIYNDLSRIIEED